MGEAHGTPDDGHLQPRLPILHQDAGRVVIHKPSGLHTHPSALSPKEDSAARWLSDQLQRRVHPVHRLDRGASGLLLFALDTEHARSLSFAFRTQQVGKVYLALVRGWLPADEGMVDRPLMDMDPASSQPREQEALTRWRVLERAEAPFCGGRGAHAWPTTRFSLLECRPESGRMHQIRRHLNGMGHPLIGDGEHGDRHLNRVVARELGLQRLALVCTQLRLPALLDMPALQLGSQLDPELRRVLARLQMGDPTAGQPALDLLEGLSLTPRRNWRQRQERVLQREADGDKDPRSAQGDLQSEAGAGLNPWILDSPPAACPLCEQATTPFHQHRDARWWSCPQCGLVHRDRAQWPSAAQAEARLAQHQNREHDGGYRRWLQPLVQAVARRMEPGGRGLDVGCGPQPVLASMCGEAGFPCAHWDPQFAPARPVPPPGGWDFITMCEVFEHLAQPRNEVEGWIEALRPGGCLVISTGILRRDQAFADWWYIRDLTHICFARPRTMAWLSARLGCQLEWAGRLAILSPNPEPNKAEAFQSGGA